MFRIASLLVPHTADRGTADSKTILYSTSVISLVCACECWKPSELSLLRCDAFDVISAPLSSTLITAPLQSPGRAVAQFERRVQMQIYRYFLCL